MKSFNRTFMELKSWFGLAEQCEQTVLIVPLWNWNIRRCWTMTSESMVLIVPLWNWNWCFTVQWERICLVLIVPLWNWNLGLNVIFCFAIIRSNRTFMELKWKSLNLAAPSPNSVLIVPLWNWNTLIRWRFFPTCWF